MNILSRIAWIVLMASMLVGSLVSIPKKEPIEIGGYHVLAADFHSHMFPGDWAMLAPWDVVLDAERNDLDVIALTGHNTTWTGKLGAWFAKQRGAPLVIVGEEVHTAQYHLVGIGLTETVSWRQSAADAIDAIHRQGGIAIAAHPIERYWNGYDAAALTRLDATEIVHPEGLRSAVSASQFAQFAQRGNFTLLGDSDSHGTGPRLCRTYVFVRNRSENGVLEALRNHRTVVYDHGQYFGDPQLVALSKSDGRLAQLSQRQVSLMYTIISNIGAMALLLLIVIGLVRR